MLFLKLESHITMYSQEIAKQKIKSILVSLQCWNFTITVFNDKRVILIGFYN